MNDATLKLLRKLKDGQGNFIWQLGLLAGQPDTLLNQKVMISNYMPLPAAGNKAILYGDLSYYWLADRGGSFPAAAGRTVRGAGSGRVQDHSARGRPSAAARIREVPADEGRE